MACNEDCDQILLAGNKTSDEGWRENGESLEIWEKFIFSLFGQIRFTTKMAEDCRGFGKRRRPWSAEVWTGEPLEFHFVFFSSIGNCWALTPTIFCSRGWESWEEAGSQDLASEEIPENIFEIMRNGTLSQVNKALT